MIKFKPSDEFLKRLIKYYKTHSELNTLDIWNGVYGHIREAIDAEDLNDLRTKLDNLYISDLWGIDYNQKNDWHLPPYEECFDKCVRYMVNTFGMVHASLEQSIQMLEEWIHIPFDMPEFPNRPVIKVGARNVPLRFCVCYHIFHRITTFLPEFFQPQNILEIGAGTGYFPYIFNEKYSNLKYSIIDLPIISVLQTYIYATMVGENKIWFHGESANDTANLLIYSPDVIQDIPPFDVALNHNSFPEIPHDVQIKYLEKVKQSLKPNGFFYSVNWEPDNFGQTPVKIACQKVGFTNISRMEFPMEEIVHHNSPKFYEEIYKYEKSSSNSTL